jgi:NAD(P)-dependent dehydrogenase (short-subunit alcohol dehydrogenase family)
MTSTAGRIALVTGANKGIGLEISRQLAKAGVHVLMGARDAARGQAAVESLVAEGGEATFVPIDLCNPASIATAAEIIAARNDRLDILVNNAGVVDGEDGAPSVANLDAMRRIFDTNFFGTVALTQALLPLIRKAPAGRIINLSSSLGSLAINGDPSTPFYTSRLLGYNASKAALNMMTVQLAAELRDTAIAVISVSPGYARTDLTGHKGGVSAGQAAEAPVRFALTADRQASGGFVNAQGEIAW